MSKVEMNQLLNLLSGANANKKEMRNFNHGIKI